MNSYDGHKCLKLLIVGVGGQGSLTIARIIGEAALLSNINVMVGQLHGMSQRGGSVSSTVVLGENKSSFIGDKQADIVLGLEPMEVLRSLSKMFDQTQVITNIGRIVPFVLARQGKPYPDLTLIRNHIRSVTQHLHEIDGPALLKQINDPRSLNLLMLGVLAGYNLLPFNDSVIWQAAEKRIKPFLIDKAQIAFNKGKMTVAGTS